MLKPARRAGYVNRVPTLDLLDQSRLAGPLPSMREDVRIDLVEGAQPARLFKGLIGAYHYLGYRQANGAQVNYLVTYRDRPVACLSFGPVAFKVAARDQFIGWSAPQRDDRFHHQSLPIKTHWLYGLRPDFRQVLCGPPS